jgi:hypothetical protein
MRWPAQRAKPQQISLLNSRIMYTAITGNEVQAYTTAFEYTNCCTGSYLRKRELCAILALQCHLSISDLHIDHIASLRAEEVLIQLLAKLASYLLDVAEVNDVSIVRDLHQCKATSNSQRHMFRVGAQQSYQNLRSFDRAHVSTTTRGIVSMPTCWPLSLTAT